MITIDYYSLLGLVYFVRSKADIYGTLKRYLADMKSFGVTVKIIQTDRGSEYFSQEGDLIEDRDRILHNFGKVCLAQDPIVRHIVQPVEMKEKVAENSFRYLFRAVNSMLWEARLCPAFWDDACAYAQYLWNRTPNVRTTDSTTPWALLTGERARWDKFKVFGCDAWQHIPNNSLYKVPGIPRGRRSLFLGFDLEFGGAKIFHPDTRTYEHSANLYFHEDMSPRQDAISFHDSQRALLKSGVNLDDLPVQSNDFADPNATAVRNLFIDPDTPAPVDKIYDYSEGEHEVCASPSSISATERVDTFSNTATHGGLHSSCDSSDSNPIRGGAAASDVLGNDADAGGVNQANQAIPTHGVTAAGQIRGLVHDGVILRPLRLMPVGTKVTVKNDDKKFLQYALHNDLPIKYLEPCPKKRLTPSRDRYLTYMLANTLREALDFGAYMEDIKWDYSHGYIQFPTHESVLPGHVFMAYDLASECGFSHVLHDYGFVQHDPCDARTYHISSDPNVSFNDIVKDIFPKDDIVPELRSAVIAQRWAEFEFAKVLNASSMKIDFDLPPEPLHYRDTLPENCGEESVKWKEAMDEEMASMSSFGVYQRVPMSVAIGRQILGCRWVYKRKTDKDGSVYRYRARLVAQGYRQKEWDSFNPDEISSPVAHKDTLRLFMTTSAALSLRVFSADVKAAFLQSPLKEKIFLKAPPGYETKTSTGEDEILELHQAIYGLKQSSASFWEAISSHLESIGFVSTMGDPCLMKRVDADGGMVLVCLYVDDITYAVSHDD